MRWHAMELVFLALIAGVQGIAQQNNSASTGKCSPSVSGNQNHIEIHSCGLDGKQFSDLKQLLNRVLAKEVSTSDLLTFMNELRDGQARIENGLITLNARLAPFVSDYLPQGDLLTSSGIGQETLSDGETTQFINMYQLQQKRDWISLRAAAQAETRKVPQWPTPLLFLAEADAATSSLEAAKRHAEEFLQKTEGNSRYMEMRKLAQSMIVSFSPLH